MLVMSRRKNETLCIGDDIRVTVVQVRGENVRIGIEAPVDVPVHREEVAELIRKEAELAGNTEVVINTEDS